MTSPSYPQRVHVRDRGRLKELVAHWEHQLATFGQELAASPDDPHRRRLYAQMLGARDQLADAARRMPMEVGDLYDEDHHRLECAVEAFERLGRQWRERSRG
jgi:hypothetical protein